MPGPIHARSGVKLTYDDYLRFPDDGKRHELIDGEHYVTASPNIRHQEISGRLYLLIGVWLETHPIGRLFYAPVDVLFSHFDVVVPDLLYMSNERSREVVTEQLVQGAPEIVMEIASPGTRRRDQTIKLRLYERWGVVEYWVIEPKRDTIHVYRKDGERFGSPADFTRDAGDVLRTSLLPGLEMPLARIFGSRTTA